MPHDLPPPAYLRQPSLRGDTVVFVSDDDLWRVGTGGGVATRLTAGLSEPATPCLSPDGRWLAYTGRDEQHAEVWLMPAAGGPARRLSFLGSELAVRGFAPDGRIVLCSNHGQPFFRNWHAFLLGTEGGLPERVPLGQIDHIAYGPEGRRVIGRNTADPARWKRYRGGRAGQLWIEDGAMGRKPHFRRMSEIEGNPSCPMWVGERLYFINDVDGVGNLWSCLPDGSTLQQHTQHREHYARTAASDGRRIVYACAAELWLHEPATGQTQRLDIQVPSARTQAARRFVPVAEHLQGVQLHPAGHSVALDVRGQLLTMALWEGAVLRHGHAPGRRRLGQWLADGRSLVCTSDSDSDIADDSDTANDNDNDKASHNASPGAGDEHIEYLVGGAVHRRRWPVGRITALRAAPSGTQLALANHRNELWLGDVASGALRRLDHSAFGRIEDPVWSPCGGWLAYTFATSTRHTAIKLAATGADQEGRTLLATQPEFRDYAPAFDPAGRYLYFLSLRTYDPVYDAVQFELSFPRAARPYLLALQAGGAPPFEPQPRGLKVQPPPAPTPPHAGDAAPIADGVRPAVPPLQPEGLVRRIAAFPVAEGRFGQIAGLRDGKVVWTALPIVGAHGRGGHPEGPGRLEQFDFDTGQVHTLLAQADSFSAAADGHTLLVKCGPTLRAIDGTQAAPAPQPAEPRPAAADGDKPSRASGLLDLARLRVDVNPPAEWAQILREVWRLQRDHFWAEDMSGIDWPAVYARYAPLLPRVATRAELSDLIWELQGELGTSHAYETGGDHRRPPAVALGHLAAELRAAPAADGGGWRILRTVQGDAWDASADSPLNAVGVAARAGEDGERIVAVGGQPVGATLPPQALLVHQAGSKVALTLAAADGTRREVLVTALADETPARYREWVEDNRDWVHQASGGRVGYLHLPDMMSAGFAEFHRYFGTECDRDALVVDLRYNRGGHVSQLLLEKVARKRIAWTTARWGQPTSYPDEAPAGAVVALTNEHAGSDGDIFSHCFKLMGIGTLVGQRTWGGVIGIWPRHKLADGTETTQPEYSYWFQDVGWGVENFGTAPQVEVANTPQDDVFNAPARDRQLSLAMNEALAASRRQESTRPLFGPRPKLGGARRPD